MKIPIPYFDQLPPIYRQALIKLENDLTDAKNIKKQRRILICFVKTYSTIPEIWKYWRGQETLHILSLSNRWYKNLLEWQISHFYSYDLLMDLLFLEKKIRKSQKIRKLCRDGPHGNIIQTKFVKNCRNQKEYKTFLNLAEKSLNFPSNKLDEIYFEYCMRVGIFISETIFQKYQKSAMEYKKLTEVEADDIKWAECLIEIVDDHDFIVESFEFKITSSPWYSRLWKLYIDYLRKSKSIQILDVYSRYCRFFIEDVGMLEDYFHDIKKFDSHRLDVSKWWIDIIKFEFTFGSLESAFKMLEKALTSNKNNYKSQKLLKFAEKNFWKFGMEKREILEKLIFEAKKAKRKNHYSQMAAELKNNNFLWSSKNDFIFDPYQILIVSDSQIENSINRKTQIPGNFNYPKLQNFILPRTICNYIFENANFFLRNQFFKSCKYFVNFYKTPICCNLVIKENSSNPPIEFFGQSIKIHENSFQSLKNFHLCNSLDAWETQNPLTVSNILSTFSKCNLKFLKLHTQNLTLKEFEILTAPGNIEAVYLVSVKVFVGISGEEAKLEELFEKFPKASRILFYTETPFSYNTAEKLFQLQRFVKIQRLELYTHELDTKKFCSFIKNNAAAKSEINIVFNLDINPDYLSEFTKHLKEMAKTWEPINDKPNIIVQ